MHNAYSFWLLAQAFFGECFCLSLFLTDLKSFHFALNLFPSIHQGLLIRGANLCRQTIQGKRDNYQFQIITIKKYKYTINIKIVKQATNFLILDLTRLNPCLDLVSIPLQLLDFLLQVCLKLLLLICIISVVNLNQYKIQKNNNRKLIQFQLQINLLSR